MSNPEPLAETRDDIVSLVRAVLTTELDALVTAGGRSYAVGVRVYRRSIDESIERVSEAVADAVYSERADLIRDKEAA